VLVAVIIAVHSVFGSAAHTAVAVEPPSLGEPTDGLSLSELKSATVLLTPDPTDPVAGGWGSGSVISSDGLILTNAHVADPTAPGQGLLFGPIVESDAPETAFRYVYTVTEDEPAAPTYRARVVAVDGYLDLAVLQIYATAAGVPLRPADLDLTAVPLADSDAASSGDPLRVLGFPGVNESLRISVTPGVVQNFADDARVGARAWINTDAQTSPGNSGGLGADADGRLVAIPSFHVERSAASVRRAMRPVNLAKPLIEAAVSGQTYDELTHVVGVEGSETLVNGGWGSLDVVTCDSTNPAFPSGTEGLMALLEFSGMPLGAHVWLGLVRDDGDLVDVRMFDWEWQESACLPVPMYAPQGSLDDGAYSVMVLVGPNYEQDLGTVSGATVGATVAPPSVAPSAEPSEAPFQPDPADVENLIGRLSEAVVTDCSPLDQAPFSGGVVVIGCEPTRSGGPDFVTFDGFLDQDDVVSNFTTLSEVLEVEPCVAGADDVMTYRHSTGETSATRYFCYQSDDGFGLMWSEPAPGLVIATAFGPDKDALLAWWSAQPAVGIGDAESNLVVGLPASGIHIRTCASTDPIGSDRQVKCEAKSLKGIRPRDIFVYDFETTSQMQRVWQRYNEDGRGSCTRNKPGTEDWTFEGGDPGGKLSCYYRSRVGEGREIPWLIWTEPRNTAIVVINLPRRQKNALARLRTWFAELPALDLGD
jgi:S1-C subfamily serine protease